MGPRGSLSSRHVVTLARNAQVQHTVQAERKIPINFFSPSPHTYIPYHHLNQKSILEKKLVALVTDAQ